MTDDALRTTDALLDAALDLAPAERLAFLDAQAPPALRAHLGHLLDAAEEDDPLLDHAPVSVAEVQSAAGSTEATAIGEVVGPYRITGLLGEGGMGRVYRAERADGAFDRDVALKLVRQSLALAGADVAERLRRERAVLASLEHPNIARLYDGGETDDGVPWVAMELIEGQPITAYADAHGLGIRERVALFVDVCRAVEHAHRRLVVHRDLKPSNVFVAPGEGGGAQVKLLDFGIARLLDVDVEGLTRTGTPVLTPEYAAPEQIRAGEITTATDVWALGVLLYEVLTGERPYRAASDTGPAGRLLALDRALQQRPAAPSEAATDADRARQLGGDLDAIVLQALRIEPENRYASAGTLADDLARHLDGLPVLARPATQWYHARAFVRRHWGAVAAAAAVVAALAVGLGAALVSLDRERAARADAQAEVERARATFEFAVGLFGGSDGATLSMETTTRELLEAGELRAARIGAHRTTERAVAYASLREIYARLHRDDEVLLAAEAAYRAALAAYGPGHSYTLEATRSYARHSVQAQDFDRVLDLTEMAEDGYRALGEAGRQPLGQLRAEIGSLLAARARTSPEWEGVAQRLLDDAEPWVMTSQDSVAIGHYLNGRGQLIGRREGPVAALPVFTDMYRIRRQFYGDSFRGLIAMLNHGHHLGQAGAFDTATAVLDSAIVIARRTIGPDHPSFTLLLSNASFAHIQRGTPEDIEIALALTEEIDRPGNGDFRWAGAVSNNRIRALRASRRWRDLDERTAQAIETFEATGERSRVSVARAHRIFSRLALGDAPEARRLAEALINDDDDGIRALAHLGLACIAHERGETAAAQVSLRAARTLDETLPPYGWRSRLVRAGPAGGACDGWVPGR